MALYKILVDDFISLDYELIAIHTTLEDYRLAYFLNKFLNIHLKKNKTNISIENKFGKSNFNHFFFDDEKNGVEWNLIENKAFGNHTTKKESGIFEKVETVTYLLPEYKTAKFLVKIENSDTAYWTKKIIDQLAQLRTISLVYAINIENLKSKNNLIF